MRLRRFHPGVGSWHFSDRVLFDPGNAALSPEATAVLSRWATMMQACPDTQLEIEGHADSGEDASDDYALSKRRGDAVKHFFEAQGIASARLSTLAYGDRRPIGTDGSESGKAQSRRAILQLIEPVRGRVHPEQ